MQFPVAANDTTSKPGFVNIGQSVQNLKLDCPTQTEYGDVTTPPTFNLQTVKVKVNFALRHATKSQNGTTVIAMTPSLTSTLDWGGLLTPRPDGFPQGWAPERSGPCEKSGTLLVSKLE